VKEDPSEFYDYEEQLARLGFGLRDRLTRLIVVKGVRRIGKSSLVRVGFRLHRVRLYAFFDARSVPVVSAESVFEVISRGLSSLMERAGGLRGVMASLLSRVEGVSVGGVRVEIRPGRPRVLVDIVEALGRVAREAGEPVILFFDEAQDFSVVPGFARMMAHIYDYVEGVKLVLAGSEVGLLDRLLGKGDPKAPLYGRPYLEIEMERLNREKSVDFLEKGFTELGLEWPRAYMEEAVGELDGIPGWLTAYGYYSYTTRSHREALGRVLHEGSLLARRELEAFLAIRRQARHRYLAILKCLRVRPMRWSELKRCMETQIGRTLNKSQYTRYLHELQDYAFIEKTGEGLYRLADPLIGHAVAKLH
jgi:hypothetical protein